MSPRHTDSSGDGSIVVDSPGPSPVSDEHLRVTGEPRLRRCWYAVAFDGDVGSDPAGRRLLGTDIVVWRSAARGVVAAIDRCPHRWAKLSAGVNDHGRLVCPYHGWTFGDTGRAALIPQLPADAALPTAACLAMLTCRVELGMVWVCLEREPLGDIPAVAEHNDPTYRAVEVGVTRYACNAAAVIDNNTDATHVAFVHSGTFGAGQDPQVPASLARRTSFGIVIESAPMPVANTPSSSAASSRSSVTEIWLPFAQVSRMRYPDGQVHILVKGCCPIDDAHTEVHLTVLRNDAERPADTQALVEFELAIELEDAAALSTLPAVFPLDIRAQCHSRYDRGGIEYRRALTELLRGEPSAVAG